MKRKTLSIPRTRIDDLSPVTTDLSKENMQSVVGGRLSGSYGRLRGSFARTQSGQKLKSDIDFSDEPIIVIGGCTSSLTEKSCDE